MVVIRNASFPGRSAPLPPGKSADLLTECRAFIRRHAMTERVFGKNACGQHDLFPALRRGRVVRPATENAIRAFMARKDRELAG